MTTAIEILAEIISNKLEKKISLFSYIEIETFDYVLELETIDEMPIYAYLEFYIKYKCIKFIVSSNQIIDSDAIDVNHDSNYNIMYYHGVILPCDSSKTNEKYTIEEIINAINSTREILPKLKFNISIGEFVTDDEADKEILALQELFTFDNVTSIYTPCSVCHGITKTKTKCNHPLCYRCWEKLFTCQIEIIKCPICRKVISSVKSEDGSEDSSEDDNAADNEVDNEVDNVADNIADNADDSEADSGADNADNNTGNNAANNAVNNTDNNADDNADDSKADSMDDNAAEKNS